MEINCYNSNKHLIYLPMCWDNALLSYSKTMGQNYEKTYAKYWGFDYSGIHGTLGQSLYKDYHMFQSLKEACNVQMEFVNYENFDEYINLLEKNLKNNIPTLIHIDNYYTPWNGLYNNMHTNHIVLVADLDIINKKIFVVDTDFIYDIFELDFDLLSKASGFYIEFHKIGDNIETTGELLLRYLNDGKLIDCQMFDRIRNFANDFKEYFDYKKEYEEPYVEKNVLDSKLIMAIRNVIMGRDLFSTFLHSAGDDLHFDFQPVEELLMTVSSRWNNIINKLYKQMFLKWNINMNESIAKCIYEIADLEEQAYKLMLHIVNEKIEKIPYKKTKPKLDSIYIVPLKEYFNNKGLAARQGEANCDITGTNEYIVINSNYQNKLFSDNEMFFMIDLEGEYDNILCGGQTITVNKNIEYKGMCVLACSEWGTNYEVFDCIDDSGNSIKAYICAHNISQLHRANIVNVGSSYNSVSHELIRDYNSFTYNQVYFEKPFRLKKIVFPNCSNLHIFSIILFN